MATPLAASAVGTRNVIETALKRVRKQFMGVLTQPFPQESTEYDLVLYRAKRLFDQTVMGGKYGRGSLCFDAYSALSPSANDEQLSRFSDVAATLEMVQAVYLIADDIMDKSEMRRGKKCWYQNERISSICNRRAPVNVSRGRLQSNVQHDELHCVANGTLSNLIRQLSSLSKHAEHIFGEIYHDAMKIDHKSNVLQQRIERLMDKVTQLDSSNEQASLDELQMRKSFKSSMLVDQHTLDRSTLPSALSEVYAKCDRPPNLDALNPYRDNPTSALSLYTDPSFFFALWRKEMLKDCPERRRMKSPSDGSKSPKKKRKPMVHTQDTQDIQQQQQRPSRRQMNTMQTAQALSFPEEYQAPQALGLQLNRGMHMQNHPSSPLMVPAGMSVRAAPVNNERSDSKVQRTTDSPKNELTKRELLPPPDLSLLAIDDDDDELPPPPPPLMHTSIVQQMPSPPPQAMQFVPSVNQMPAPPPPAPPPPPPPAPPPPFAAATFAGQSTSNPSSTEPKQQTNDVRSDLLADIRKGYELKKVARREEEEAARAAEEQNDVAAILRRRMEHVLGGDDDSQSSQESDDEWD